ncbi:hypothetical protein JOD54_004050 [Actinokineospora baliensis]|uniref:hypothetical protein n=1 Tax=Actinokineospora baliensis TaxID=547056 RepID=UPI00195B2F33|nr:hypothetical protein [Actinokineospora baliensis]MBM7773846.1 hypothetical protein [Actinokineospora baliensis]
MRENDNTTQDELGGPVGHDRGDDQVGAMELERPKGIGVRAHLMMGLVLASTVLPSVLTTSHSSSDIPFLA